MTEDEYGNVIQVDAPALKWYANDIEIKGGDLEFNNGNELSFTINTDNGTVTMSKPNDGKMYTGSVTVKAVTPDGSDSASVTVTVVGDQVWAKNAQVHPVGKDNTPDDSPINSYVGGTVKLADVKYGVYNVEEGTSVAAKDVYKRQLVLFVIAGVALGALGIYEPLIEFAGAGATTPLTGFGYSLSQGAIKGAREEGLMGALSGGIAATAAGVAASIVFGYIAALCSRPRSKD